MKKAAGFYLTAASAVLALLGTVFYFVNCNTNYFKKDGTNTTVIIALVAGVVLAVLALLAGKAPKVCTDLASMAAPAAMMASLMLFLNDRIVGIAAIMTFTNNAQNQADLRSAFVAMGLLLVGVIVGIVGNFVATLKD